MLKPSKLLWFLCLCSYYVSIVDFTEVRQRSALYWARPYSDVHSIIVVTDVVVATWYDVFCCCPAQGRYPTSGAYHLTKLFCQFMSFFNAVTSFSYHLVHIVLFGCRGSNCGQWGAEVLVLFLDLYQYPHLKQLCKVYGRRHNSGCIGLRVHQYASSLCCIRCCPA